MTLTLFPLPSRDLSSRRLLKSRLSPVKVAMTCLASCIALSLNTSASARPEKEISPLEDFAGAYTGEVTVSQVQAGFSLPGTGDGFFRGRRVGGVIRLNSSVSGGELNIAATRDLRFSRRLMTSTSTLNSNGNVSPGSGLGFYSFSRKLIRYTDNSTFQLGESTLPAQITGEVRFFKRLIQVTETWNVMGGATTFTYNLRPRR